MTHSYATAALWAALSAGIPAHAAPLSLAPCFNDHMVLQRGGPIPIWGLAGPGEKVYLRFQGKTVSAAAGDDGKWMATLDTYPAGGPFELAVQGSASALTLSDVWVGEVWVGGGQSNMEVRMGAAAFPTAANKDTASHADIPQLRLFDMRNRGSGWMVCNPANTLKFSATAFYFGRELVRNLNVPVGLVLTALGGTTIDRWIDPAAIAADPGLKRDDSASIHFNAYVAPVIPMAMRGVIWYQGENDANPQLSPAYAKRFRSLITGWRKTWGRGDFPFLFAQLCSRFQLQTTPIENEFAWPEIREAQRLALSLPNTAMAVTWDLFYPGNPDEVHPPDKYPVGLRLSLCARALAYGEKDLPYSGPMYDTLAMEGHNIRLRFRQVGRGFQVRGGGKITGFAVCGSDGKWYWGDAVIQGQDILVSSASVPVPVKVRLGSADHPDINLYNLDGLPASPFRTGMPRTVTDITKRYSHGWVKMVRALDPVRDAAGRIHASSRQPSRAFRSLSLP